jgi:hypothetical protein
MPDDRLWLLKQVFLVEDYRVSESTSVETEKKDLEVFI